MTTQPVHFSQVHAFLAELEARPPNVEPVLRCGYEKRPPQTATGTALPFEHIYVRASYLRSVGNVLLVVKLEHYCGQSWGAPEPVNAPDAGTEAHRVAVVAKLEAAAAEHHLELSDGSMYA